MEHIAHRTFADEDTDPAVEAAAPRPLLERADGVGRVTVGILTALSPVSTVAALFVGTLHAIRGVAAQSVWGPVAMVLLIYSIVWTGLLLLFYAPHLLGSRWIGETSKKLWALAFLFAAPIALPFYFVAHVWRDRGRPSGPSPAHPFVEPRKIRVTEIPQH